MPSAEKRAYHFFGSVSSTQRLLKICLEEADLSLIELFLENKIKIGQFPWQNL